MKLTLTDDDGVILESWYIPDAEIEASSVAEAIEEHVPCWYESREKWAARLEEEDELWRSLSPPPPKDDLEF